MPMLPDHPLLHSYVLRIWQEPPSPFTPANYRFSLIDSRTHEWHTFESFEQLTSYLHEWLRGYAQQNP